jgi:hypothetical protein
MFKAVIFDVDGTLLDSVDQHALQRSNVPTARGWSGKKDEVEIYSRMLGISDLVDELVLKTRPIYYPGGTFCLRTPLADGSWTHRNQYLTKRSAMSKMSARRLGLAM